MFFVFCFNGNLVSTMATESSTSTESSQFDQLLAAINESKSSFKRDLAQLKEEVKKGQEEAAERVAKKAKSIDTTNNMDRKQEVASCCHVLYAGNDVDDV